MNFSNDINRFGVNNIHQSSFYQIVAFFTQRKTIV